MAVCAAFPAHSRGRPERARMNHYFDCPIFPDPVYMTQTLLTRARRSAEFRLDKLTTRFRNDRLDQAFAADRTTHLDRIDAAISRGIGWLGPQRDVSMSVLYCALQTLRHTGDVRFECVRAQMDHYRATINDPAFRVLDKGYDDTAPEVTALPSVMDVRPYYDVELMMIDTAWADLRPQPDILDRLAAFDDNGGYGSTHIIIGALILKQNGGADAQALNALIQSQIPVIARANDLTARAEDLFAERIMCLQWLGLHDLVRPAWIMRLVDRQLPDGGWTGRNIPPEGQSNQHTTVLALAALAEFLHHHRPRN